jgi:putative acyl-CoA dehydrogenase
VAEALAHEVAPARGTHAAFDAVLERVLQGLDGVTEETQARGLARDTALVIQAALLKQHAPDAVFGAFCAGRLQQGSDVFGALPAGCDLDALIARAQLH